MTSGTDVFRTLLAFARGEPAGAQDMRDPASFPRDRIVHAEANLGRSMRRMVVTDAGKWIAEIALRNPTPIATERFDLARDPHELPPLAWEEGTREIRALLELASEDRDLIGDFRALDMGERLSAPKVAPAISDEAREKLRALGYIE